VPAGSSSKQEAGVPSAGVESALEKDLKGAAQERSPEQNALATAYHFLRDSQEIQQSLPSADSFPEQRRDLSQSELVAKLRERLSEQEKQEKFFREFPWNEAFSSFPQLEDPHIDDKSGHLLIGPMGRPLAVTRSRHGLVRAIADGAVPTSGSELAQILKELRGRGRPRKLDSIKHAVQAYAAHHYAHDLSGATRGSARVLAHSPQVLRILKPDAPAVRNLSAGRYRSVYGVSLRTVTSWIDTVRKRVLSRR
jgi:hypothetical protein